MQTNILPSTSNVDIVQQVSLVPARGAPDMAQQRNGGVQDRMRAALSNGLGGLQIVAQSQIGRAVAAGALTGLAANTMLDANSSASVGLVVTAMTLIPQLKSAQGKATELKATEQVTEVEREAGVLGKKDLGGVRDYMASAGQVTKADLRRIKPISELSKHEGVLNGITIRVDQAGEDNIKTKVRLSLREAVVDKLQTPNEHGETRYFVRSTNGPLADKFADKSPNFCRESHLLDAVTLMRADVTRAIQKIKGEGEISEPAVSGDNFHVDGLDLSAANIQPGDIIKVGQALLFATENPHYACGQFESRFGALAYDFINSEAEFTVPDVEYNTQTFSNVERLKDIERAIVENKNYPELAKERLGAFHRLRGIRLAVLETGSMSLGDAVKVFRQNADGQYRFDNGQMQEILAGITDEHKAYIARLNDGPLVGNERVVRAVNDEYRPHVTGRQNAQTVHAKQVENRNRDQARIEAGKRRNDCAEPWFNIDGKFQWQKLVG